ncbi:DUF4397 domain-containing protein [Myxococcus sp. CA033]|uniref:DUF4397 domain-containing protein n=1 Tax=Myxococcus sp. CA033 TaxID=2741516 RepID=UPI00157AD2C1|nr:DUF4397 domain-containing protein [Myxococcus sp. CA033]NTX35144.1 DUF4397 domain-containing protein [Myxococcus sp. CA033]
MKRNVLGSWLLMVGLALGVGVTGCGDDDEGPPDSGSVDSGYDAGRDSGAPPVDAGCDGGQGGCDGGHPPVDGGEDGGPTSTDGGEDGGPTPTDGGEDAGPPDAGPPDFRAHVRFINAFVGLKNNPTDVADRPWEPFHVTLRVGDAETFPVVKAGAAAVSEFREVILTGPTQSVRVVARDAEGTSEAPDLAALAEVTLADDEWVTVVGAGSLLQVGQERPDKPRLVVLRDHALTLSAQPGNVHVRFMSADRVLSASARRRLANEAGEPYENNSVDAYSADVVEQGVLVPVDTKRVAVIGTSPIFAPAQSGWLFYSLADGTLTEGKAYYAINTGEDRRTLSDEGAPALLFVTAKENTVARFQRGPLVYLFNGLLPATVGGTTPQLQAIRGSSNIATAMAYGAAPKVADLPVSTAGFSLRFTVNGQPGQGVLEGAATGPLEAGRRYLGVLCGRVEASPTLTVVRDEFSAEGAQSPFLRFIHCSASSPAPLTFGSYSFQADGSSREVFTPLFTGATFATATQPATGAAFSPPVSTTTPVYTWLGLRTADATPIERTIRGRVLGTPTFLVLIGEWENTLTYRAINTRVNAWSPSAPNDPFFSPLTPAP